MARISFDNGIGGTTGQWFSLHFGPGSGYMRSWWVNLNAGPGQAVKPNTPCGHSGFKHCNSIHCTRLYCRLVPRIPFVSRGATLRVWIGPTYNRSKFSEWKSYLRMLARLQYHAYGSNVWLYKLISFRF